MADPVARARQVEALGADYISVHVAIDEQMRGRDPFAILHAVSQAVQVPVGVAGGINSETAAAGRGPRGRLRHRGGRHHQGQGPGGGHPGDPPGPG